MIRIGDKVNTNIHPMSIVWVVTGIHVCNDSPSKRLRYALNGEPAIWFDDELTPAGRLEIFPETKFRIDEEVKVKGAVYRVEAINAQPRNCLTTISYRYKLRPLAGGKCIHRDEKYITQCNPYTLF